MKKKKIAKVLAHTLVATVYTVPYTGVALGEMKPEGPGAPKTQEVSQAISQEVIQLLQEKEKPGMHRFNIAGRPGVHFRIYYSPTGEEGSYKPLPGGEGVIGDNGMASLSLSLKELGEENLYLKVFTSDSADFKGQVRVNASPLALMSEEPEMKLRGFFDRRYRVRTPTAVAAVRGALPERKIEKR